MDVMYTSEEDDQQGYLWPYNLNRNKTTSQLPARNKQTKHKKTLLIGNRKANNPVGLSMDLWANLKTNKDCVRFYKAQHAISLKYPKIDINKFLLLIITNPQLEFMKKFSKRLICIDRQKVKDFELMSLLVLDERAKCLPCAYMLTNEVDSEIAKTFFMEVKNITGLLETNVFLSDKTNIISNAWDKAMVESEKSMVCSWDVLSDWESMLVKVKSEHKRDNILKELKHILKERDINDFTTRYMTLTKKLFSDPETKEFVYFLEKNYSNSPQSWAGCYRFENEDIDGYMELEKMHSIIGHILQFKAKKSIVKFLKAVLEFSRNKIYERLIMKSDGEVSSKMSEMRDRHKTALIVTYHITCHEDFWSVVSGKKRYEVKVADKNCTCQLTCIVCKFCVHAFSCSCDDSLLKLNMCKHIHSVCICEAAVSKATSFNESGVMEVKCDAKQGKPPPSSNILSKACTTITTQSNGKVNSSLMLTHNAVDISEFEIPLVLEKSQDSDANYDKTNYETLDYSEICSQVISTQEVTTSDSINSIDTRKSIMESAFKEILKNIQSEEQLLMVESAFSIMQKKVTKLLDKSAKKRSNEELLNKPVKVLKVGSDASNELSTEVEENLLQNFAHTDCLL